MPMPTYRHHNSIVPFPSPYRNQDIYYQDLFDQESHYDYHARRPRRRAPAATPLEKRVSVLKDKEAKQHGDLGWTLDYATAHVYTHLLGNRTGVRDAIDTARRMPCDIKTPFFVFDPLDCALFAGKMKGMLLLKWVAMMSSAPGATKTPGVTSPRITIELNRTPFVEGNSGIDELLDALIHQMIHGFFLVCCGAQPKAEKQDGRLLDGTHFGVVLRTIRDISRGCREGPLKLIFYSGERRAHGSFTGPWSATPRRGRGHDYIALHSCGSAVGPPPSDGCSHCSHENAHVTMAEIKNWQVKVYQAAIDLELEAKGDVIYDLRDWNELVPIDRLNGPPSATYVELIWDGKHIMAKSEKAFRYESIKSPLNKDGKRQLKVPVCTKEVMWFLHDFINKGSYWDPENIPKALRPTRDLRARPPVLRDHRAGTNELLTQHIAVFKVAEGMKFEELQKYALQRLWSMQTTNDDPLMALRELYNNGDKSKPVHAELHRWARKFLTQIEHPATTSAIEGYRLGYAEGLSNLAKICHSYGDALVDFYQKCTAFKEDFDIAQLELLHKGFVPANLPAAASIAMGPTVSPQRPLTFDYNGPQLLALMEERERSEFGLHSSLRRSSLPQPSVVPSAIQRTRSLSPAALAFPGATAVYDPSWVGPVYQDAYDLAVPRSHGQRPERASSYVPGWY